jgi:hypothetical protein
MPREKKRFGSLRFGFQTRDPRLLVLLFILLASFGSIHPHPGPFTKSFESSEERKLFNSLRGKESKAIRMESHLDFLQNCFSSNIIPRGLDFKVELCAAFDGRNINIEGFMRRSKMTLLGTIIQHYQNQLPNVQEEIRVMDTRFAEICTEFRYRQMRQDLNFFSKRIKQKCKRTKIIKKKNLEKELHMRGDDETGTWWIPELKLRQMEHDIIAQNEWLIDEVMDAASTLLKQQFPCITGLDNASLGVSAAGFDRNLSEGMQFHCVGGCHWVLSSSIGGQVRIYDSLPSKYISQDLDRQLRAI